jgi:hypothetical protein
MLIGSLGEECGFEEKPTLLCKAKGEMFQVHLEGTLYS